MFFSFQFLFGHLHIGPWKGIIPHHKNTLPPLIPLFTIPSDFLSTPSPSLLLLSDLSHPSLSTPLSVSLISSHYISLSLLPAPIIPPTHSHNCSATLKCRSQSPKPHTEIFLSSGLNITDQWSYIEYQNPQFISILYSLCSWTTVALYESQTMGKYLW